MKKLYQQIFENHRLKQLNERTGWKMGPQFWDTDEPIAKPTPRNPATSPSQPYVPTPGFNGDPDVYVNQPGPGMPSPTRANEPLNIPPSLPTYPLADPRLSDTNKPMRVPRPRNPNEILPGIFNTGTINKPNGNSPPVIWYQDLNNGKWYKAILMCYQSGCVYASQADDPLMVRDSPPDGFVIWNPSPPPGRFEVYHDPEFEWFKPSTWGW
jgi:hypothetical protein